MHLATQLTAWYFVSSFLIVGLVSGFLYWSMDQTLTFESRRILEGRLHTLRLLCGEQPFDLARLRQRVEIEWPATVGDRFYVRATRPGGTVVAATPNMPDTALSALDAAAMPAEGVALSELSTLGVDEDFRIISERLRTPVFPLDVRIALDYGAELKLLRDLRVRLVWTLAVALVICGFVARQISRRGVAPVEAIGRVTARITSSSLHERLDWRGFPVELAVLARTFNDMLDRLHHAFKRQAQFSADIAHELKTPVGNMAGEIEVALGRQRTAADYHDVLGSCLEECHRISRIVDSLLLLAQCDERQEALRTESVDLRPELDHLIDFYEVAASEKQLSMALTGPPSLILPADRTLLHRAVGNLLANAIKQTPAGGRIDVAFAAEAGSALIEVQDTGCGIPAEHLPFVFDRFYRVDRSRSQRSGGFGLGLAIVRSIAAVHGGSVQIDSEVGRGTTVRLRLPLAVAVR